MVGIGKKPGSGRPEKKVTIIIRDGDDPVGVVKRLRRKHKLLKGQAEVLVREISDMIQEYFATLGLEQGYDRNGGTIIKRSMMKSFSSLVVTTETMTEGLSGTLGVT